MTIKKLRAVNENGHVIGQSHGRAKFTDAEVEMMRQLREEGMKLREIAGIFECALVTVHSICKYKRRAQTAARYKEIELPASEATAGDE